MYKSILKATTTVIGTELLSYSIYLTLLIFGIIHYYETFDVFEDVIANMPVSVCFFIAPLIVSFFVVFFLKKIDKAFIITFLVELLILGCLKMELCRLGVSDILLWVSYKTFNKKELGSLDYISPVLSTVLFCLFILLGKTVSIKRKEKTQ